MQLASLAALLVLATACDRGTVGADDTGAVDTGVDDTASDNPDTGDLPACDPAAAEVEGHNDVEGPVLFELSGFSVADEDGDGAWEPGERLDVTGRIANVSGEDDMGYPGALLRADPEVDLGGGEWWFYGLFADQEAQVEFTALAPDDAAPGTVVRFTATAARLGCNDQGFCPNPAPVCFDVVIAGE